MCIYSTETGTQDSVVTTISHTKVNLLNPAPDTILIRDIAHHLSQINRYNGGCPFPYSVAQHSLLVASVLPEEFKLWGLLHDAAEAYVGDDVKQKKYLIAGLKDLENSIQIVICAKFGLSWPEPQIVKQADLDVYAMEKLTLQHYADAPALLPSSVQNLRVEPMDWFDVYEEFMARFYQLTMGQVEINHDNGKRFFAGDAYLAYWTLRKHWGPSACMDALESGVIPSFTIPGLGIRPAA